jgi:hypothetical protein
LLSAGVKNGRIAAEEKRLGPVDEIGAKVWSTQVVVYQRPPQKPEAGMMTPFK